MRDFLRTVARTFAALATCLGCSSRDEQPIKPPPPRIRWTGEETGYRSETQSPAKQPEEARGPKQEINHP